MRVIARVDNDAGYGDKKYIIEATEQELACISGCYLSELDLKKEIVVNKLWNQLLQISTLPQTMKKFAKEIRDLMDQLEKIQPPYMK